jgi:hypothetical protein
LKQQAMRMRCGSWEISRPQGKIEGKRITSAPLKSLQHTHRKKGAIMNILNWRSTVVTLAILLPAPVWLPAQDGNSAQVREQVAQLKQAVAKNRVQLKKYQWIEATEVSVKGETKKDEQSSCHYGPDGKVVKTKIGVESQPKDLPGGLRGKMAKKKIGEMKDYMDRLKALIGHYAPPDSEMMQASFRAGKANLNLSSGGLSSLTFRDYYKQGDEVTFGFDTAAKKLTNYDVNTYLDGPKDVVTLANQFATLPDNTNYVQQTILTSKSKEIEIKKTNSQYTLVAQ